MNKKIIYLAISIIVVVLVLFFVIQSSQHGPQTSPIQNNQNGTGQSNLPPAGWVSVTTTVATTTAGSVAATFFYPQDLGTTYVRLVDWPPALAFQNQLFTCTEAGLETMRAGQTKLETINGNQFCVTRESEGAAGSIYTNYAYAFPFHGQGLNGQEIFTFSIQFPQCVNYDDPKRTECQAEEQSFNIGPTIDQMVHTIAVPQ